MKYLLLLVSFVVFACTATTENTSTTEKDYNYNVKIHIEGMTCTGCENTIETTLNTIEGIEAADASHTESLAKIVLNANNVDTVVIKNALSEAGYTLVSIENIE